MRVLLVNKYLYLKGGSERYMFSVADAFKSLGHEVIFFSMEDEKNIQCATSKYFVKNKSKDGKLSSKLNLVFHLSYSKEAYKNITKLLNDEKPDLVILNLIHKQLTCSVIQAIKDYDKNLPIFWTVHDLIHVCPAYTMIDGKGNICEKCLFGDFSNCAINKCCHGSKIMSVLSAREAKQIKKHGWYDLVDLYICPSVFYKNMLEKSHFTSSKLVCLRNPLPLDTTYKTCSGDGGYLLYFGRLSKEKGVMTLIKAIKDINCQLYVVGTGPEEKTLKQYVLDNNINNVCFKGFQTGETLDDIISKSHCVVLPSEWYENGPYSAMEAMAHGKPLIVSNNGGLPELVTDNGYVYSDFSQLVASVKSIISLDSQSYLQMCSNSVKKAKQLFDPKQYISSLLEEYYEKTKTSSSLV